MTISAINPQARNVVLMAERHLLNPRHTLISRVWRSVNGINQSPRSKKTYDAGAQSHSRDVIAAFAKNLSHVSAFRSTKYPRFRSALTISRRDQALMADLA